MPPDRCYKRDQTAMLQKVKVERMITDILHELIDEVTPKPEEVWSLSDSEEEDSVASPTEHSEGNFQSGNSNYN